MGHLGSELSISKSFFQELSKGHLSVKSPDLKIGTWTVGSNPNYVSLKSGRRGLLPCKPLSWFLVNFYLDFPLPLGVSFAVESCMADWQCHLIREGMILTLKAAVGHELFSCFVVFCDKGSLDAEQASEMAVLAVSREKDVGC